MLQTFSASDAKPNRCARRGSARAGVHGCRPIWVSHSRGENDLADMLASVHAGMGLGHVVEGEVRIDHRPAAALGQERQTLSSRAAAIAAFSATERARRVEPVWVRRLSISRRKSSSTLLPCEEGDLDDPPVLRRGLVVARDIVAADHVEDHVGAPAAGGLLDRRDEILPRGN